jgi:hypothetical protein
MYEIRVNSYYYKSKRARKNNPRLSSSIYSAFSFLVQTHFPEEINMLEHCFFCSAKQKLYQVNIVKAFVNKILCDNFPGFSSCIHCIKSLFALVIILVVCAFAKFFACSATNL